MFYIEGGLPRRKGAYGAVRCSAWLCAGSVHVGGMGIGVCYRDVAQLMVQL